MKTLDALVTPETSSEKVTPTPPVGVIYLLLLINPAVAAINRYQRQYSRAAHRLRNRPNDDAPEKTGRTIQFVSTKQTRQNDVPVVRQYVQRVGASFLT